MKTPVGAYGAMLAFGSVAALAQERMEPPFVPTVPAYEERRVSSRLIHFPPVPPVLDPALVESADQRSPSPMRQATADFHLDPFFPDLCMRFTHRELTPEMRAALDEYLADKLEMQREIREAVFESGERPLPDRLSRLSELAARQAPRLAQLEKKAAGLTRQLRQKGREWGAYREATIRRPDDHEPAEIASVLRAAACFEPGLTQLQRDLLHLIAEQVSEGFAPDSTEANAPYRHFVPVLGRPLFPDPLPPGVADKLTRIDRLLAQLKRDLHTTVLAQDSAHPSARRRAFAALARRQAPEIERAEMLAEEVRRQLDLFPGGVRRLYVDSLPTHHRRAVADLLAQHRDLQANASRRIQALAAGSPGAMILHRFKGERIEHGLVSRRPTSRDRFKAESSEGMARLAAALEEIAAEFTAGYRMLAARGERLRAEIANEVAPDNQLAVDKAVAKAIRDALTAHEGDPLDDYRIAMYTAGLSPAQRRLMLDAAMSRLPVRPPRPERQPVTPRA